MSESYKAVSWNRQKLIYDGILAGGMVLYLAVFIGLGALLRPNATAETLLIRGLGTLAFVMLHVVLLIGPAARLFPELLPLLYNRRHFGVATFFTGLAHGAFALFQFHGFSDLNPLVSLLVSNTRFTSVPEFPFELLGAGALVILFLMAATSHDVWLEILTAPVWKVLHMLVYAAYALLVGHVVLGVLQAERDPVLAVSLGLGAVLVTAAHVAAALKESSADHEREANAKGWVEVCDAEDIPEDRACVAVVGGERIAVFRYDGKVSAVSNVCQHQNGPLGEGRIIDGCITCPWHGFQYDPETGASPPPFTEKVPTFNVRISKGRVFVHRTPNEAGERVEPARVTEKPEAGNAGETEEE